MRAFLLSLSAKYQLFLIVFCTIVVAFISAIAIYLLFGSMELISKAGLITAIYAVLGTIYAVLVAFSVSGVWQNYCAAELAVTAEVAALMDLVHTVGASATEKAPLIRDLAIEYVNEVIAIEWPTLASGENEIIMSPKSKPLMLSQHMIREIQTIQTANARDNVIFSHVLTLLTKWLDSRRMRIMVSKGNIAKSLWPVLIAGAFILFAFHGLFIVENHILWSTLLLFFAGVIGLAFYLIFTLDSPFAGSPIVDAGPFKWALIWLRDQKTLNEEPKSVVI